MCRHNIPIHIHLFSLFIRFVSFFFSSLFVCSQTHAFASISGQCLQRMRTRQMKKKKNGTRTNEWIEWAKWIMPAQKKIEASCDTKHIFRQISERILVFMVARKCFSNSHNEIMAFATYIYYIFSPIAADFVGKSGGGKKKSMDLFLFRFRHCQFVIMRTANGMLWECLRRNGCERRNIVWWMACERLVCAFFECARSFEYSCRIRERKCSDRSNGRRYAICNQRACQTTPLSILFTYSFEYTVFVDHSKCTDFRHAPRFDGIWKK